MPICKVCSITESVEVYKFKWVHNGMEKTELIYACKPCICHCSNTDLNYPIPDDARFNIIKLLKFLLSKAT